MFSDVMASLVTLHGGTPAALSQMTLTLMLVALGILVIGISFGRLTKTKLGLLQHRWNLTIVTILALTAIFLVMLPSVFNFYIDPDLQFFSPLSITTLIHAIVGAPAVTLAVTYAFGDLPIKVKKWMHIAAAFWVANLALGVVLFLQMQELI